MQAIQLAQTDNFISTHLNHACYHVLKMVKGYNFPVTAITALMARDSAKLLKALNPAWTREDHQRLAEQHRAESTRLSIEHTSLLDQAHNETFGCARKFEDYKVSAIGRTEYSHEMKERLRFAAKAATNHNTLSLAHAAAAARF